MSKKKKVLMIFTEWGANEYRKKYNAFGGVGYYRIVKPAQYLEKYFDVDVYGSNLTTFGKTQPEMWKNIFEKYDLVYPRHVDSISGGNAMLAMADHFGKKVFMDLDDNYMEVKPDSPAYTDYHPGSVKQVITKTIMSLCDAVTVSTEPLKEAYKDINKNVYVCPNFNDYRDWMHMPTKHNDQIIRLGWAGSTTHDEDLALIVPPVKHLLEKYKNLEFHILGGIPHEKIVDFKAKFGKKMKKKVYIHFGTPSWTGYPERLAEMGWDIGIAPLVDDGFTVCKSHIKWMEYAMIGIPCVASKVYPYYKDIFKHKTITDGETGFLATTQDEWIDKLSKLIEDHKLRKKIAINAYNHITENWQWEDNAKYWVDAINKHI